MKDTFILKQDNDCHWFVIPKNKENEWENIVTSVENGEEDFPDWVREVGGSPSIVQFAEFSID